MMSWRYPPPWLECEATSPAVCPGGRGRRRPRVCFHSQAQEPLGLSRVCSLNPLRGLGSSEHLGVSRLPAVPWRSGAPRSALAPPKCEGTDLYSPTLSQVAAFSGSPEGEACRGLVSACSQLEMLGSPWDMPLCQKVPPTLPRTCLPGSIHMQSPGLMVNFCHLSRSQKLQGILWVSA